MTYFIGLYSLIGRTISTRIGRSCCQGAGTGAFVHFAAVQETAATATSVAPAKQNLTKGVSVTLAGDCSANLLRCVSGVSKLSLMEMSVTAAGGRCNLFFGKA